MIYGKSAAPCYPRDRGIYFFGTQPLARRLTFKIYPEDSLCHEL